MKWFEGPRKKINRTPSSPRKDRRVLLVLDSRLFAKRDVKAKPTKELSESMLRQASEIYDHVLVLVTVVHFVRERFSELTRGLPNIEVLYSEDVAGGFLNMVETTKQKIISYGIEFKHVRNPREINYLNLHKFVKQDQNLVVAATDEWKKAGLDLDKPLSFNDIAQKRKAKSFW